MQYNPFDSLPEVHMTPVVTRKLLAYQEGEQGYTITLMKAKAGATAPLHSHPHQQVVYVLSGKGDFHCGDDIQTVKPGDVIQIGSDVPHTFDSFAEDTVWMEFFTPERLDYKP